MLGAFPEFTLAVVFVVMFYFVALSFSLVNGNFLYLCLLLSLSLFLLCVFSVVFFCLLDKS